ncbi:gas vesicle protein [Kitasatospora sp. NPDC018058]|uniref:gas vesicle protein n=1 Tax=Kitasatospora sp. NPDC018058 TaxID=3364025 RepID=UPI0037C09B3E
MLDSVGAMRLLAHALAVAVRPRAVLSSITCSPGWPAGRRRGWLRSCRPGAGGRAVGCTTIACAAPAASPGTGHQVDRTGPVHGHPPRENATGGTPPSRASRGPSVGGWRLGLLLVVLVVLGSGAHVRWGWRGDVPLLGLLGANWVGAAGTEGWFMPRYSEDDDRRPTRKPQRGLSGPEGDEPVRRVPRKSGPQLSVAAVLRAALEQLGMLLGRVPESVSGLRRTDEGWQADVEVVEVERVPDTASILASYRVTLDSKGELLGYERTRRYTRDELDRQR